MARYFTDREKAEIRDWLIELREIVPPDKFAQTVIEPVNSWHCSINARRTPPASSVTSISGCGRFGGGWKLKPTDITPPEWRNQRPANANNNLDCPRSLFLPAGGKPNLVRGFLF
jgi:hypothetical protein